MNQDSLRAYYNGMKDGVRRFAWWREGEQYVGTCGTTLSKAIEDIEAEECQALTMPKRALTLGD